MEKNYINYIHPYLKELSPLEAIATPAKADYSTGKYKAVIFDIYGTLLISASGDVDKASYSASMIKKALLAANFKIINDTEESYDIIYSSYNECLKAHHQKGKDEGRPYPEVNILEVTKDALKKAEEEGRIEATEDSDIKLFNFVFELQTNHVWPMPQMQNVIKTLGESDLLLGIVSNAQYYTPVIMNHFLYGEEIDTDVIAPFKKELCVYSYQELRGKPDTALFEKLVPELASLGITPEEALFVGNDMLKDIYTASQVGFKTVFFAGDQRAYRLHEGDVRCDGLKADYTITKLSQLLEIVGLK